MGTPTSSGRSRTRIVAVVVAGALALTACSDWRLETPPPSPLPTPADETRRHAVAEAAAELVAAVAADPTGAGVSAAFDGATIAGFETDAASAQLDALGGLYVPYPAATPSPAASPVPAPALDAAASALRDSALARSREAEDPSLALLLSSIGLSQALALERAAFTAEYATWEAQGDPREDPDAVQGGAPANPKAGLADEEVEFEAPSRVAERTIYDATDAGDGAPFTTPLPAAGDVAALEAAGVSPAAIDSLVASHDRLNYAYEILRARLGPRVYRLAARDRQFLHWHRADALGAEAGRDPRSPAYELDRAALDSEEGMLDLVRALEYALGDAYMAAYGEAVAAGETERAAWLLTGAFDAYLAAFTWWGGEELPTPTFPGADVAVSG